MLTSVVTKSAFFFMPVRMTDSFEGNSEVEASDPHAAIKTDTDIKPTVKKRAERLKSFIFISPYFIIMQS